VERGSGAPGAPTSTEAETTLRDYLDVVQRRKWVVLQALVLVPAAAIAFSLTQTKLYEASAEVLISQQNLAAALTGTEGASVYREETRLAQTQADLAGVPEVARRVLDKTNLTDRSAQELLDATSISSRTNSDLLQFSVTDPDPETAQRLATAYAQTFTDYRTELDTAPIVRAQRAVEANLDELRASGETGGPLYASLVAKLQQLKTFEALQTSNTYVVREAEDATQVQPRPVRNAVLGVLLGLVLGIGIAFLRDALDTRVRTAEEIGARLGLPLLARLPRPSKKLERKNQLVMLADPSSVHAEAFRVLRTNLQFARLERDVRSVMVTSAHELEGKSTTVANLAVALARGGERVVLVDLDLRRATLGRFFGLDDHPGLTDVALGQLDLDEALAPIILEGGIRQRGTPMGAYEPLPGGEVEGRGSLHVLPAGPLPPDPGEFVGGRRLGVILEALRERGGTVLIDAPPVLHVGDPMTISTKVDGLILVTRINVVRRHTLTELSRHLAVSPTAKLGFVLTGAGDEHGYGYGYGYSHKPARPSRRARRKEKESVERA
jgi:polysaccharide biosynthesis transport protein